MKTFSLLKPTISLAIAALCGMSAACASAQDIQEAPEGEASAVEKAEKGEFSAISGPETTAEKRPVEWASYLNAPDSEEMKSHAVSPPILQDNTSITVITAPEGFDSAAYVVTEGVRGIYLIDNVFKQEDALARGNELVEIIKENFSIEEHETEANNALLASTFISSAQADLKVINIIVAPDMVGGNTVTVAFSY